MSRNIDGFKSMTKDHIISLNATPKPSKPTPKIDECIAKLSKKS